MRTGLAVWLGVCAVLLGSGWALSQARTGAIYGTVTDPDGTPLPGVTVTIEHVRIGQQATVADANGIFRFPSLPPAPNYRLRFELEGFLTVIRQDVAVRVGTSVKLDVQMAPGAGEEVVVRGGSPVVDIKNVAVAQNFTQELLQQLPTARDPWAVLELVPGVFGDNANIGGSESGKHAHVSTRGAYNSDNQYNLDGVDITDPAFLGHTPTHFDFDAFEEIQVRTSDADTEGFSSGVAVNFVTRRGSNRLSGGGRYYYAGKELGTRNVEKLREEGRLISPATQGTRPGRVRDYGFNLGGPLITEHFWFWLGYGAQRVELLVPLAGQEDQRETIFLDNVDAKLNATVGVHNLEFLFFFGDRKQFGSGAAWNRPPETTRDEKGPSPLFKLQDEFLIGDRLYVSLQGSMNLNHFQMIPRGGTTVPVELDYGTFIWSGSYWWYDTERPTLSLAGRALYYTRGLGMNHEIKIGVEYRYALVEDQAGMGNGLVIARYPPEWGFGAGEVWLIRPENTNISTRRLSLYAQDTLSVGRLTLILGVRFDHQKLGMKEAVVPAVTVFGDHSAMWLPEGRAEAGDVPFAWNTLSPRLGLTVDLTGDAKTLLKANFALYPEPLSLCLCVLQPTRLREVDFWWFADLNGDHTPDADEIYWDYPIWWDHTPGRPNDVNAVIDPDLRSSKTVEFTVGIEREIVEDFAIALNAHYRRYTDFQWYFPWQPGTPAQMDETYFQCWEQVGNIPEEWGGWPYYACNVPNPEGIFLTNQPLVHQEYRALELRITKRMSRSWSLFGSFTIQNFTRHYEGRRAYLDPTSIEQLNGQPYATTGWRTGFNYAYGNVQWMGKFGGIVRLPGDFNLGATLFVRQGFMFASYFRAVLPPPYRFLGWGSTTWVLTEKMGEQRFDTLWYIHARIEKMFDLGEYGRIHLALDAFNLTNNGIPTGMLGLAGDPDYRKVIDILAPRVFRIGARYEF